MQNDRNKAFAHSTAAGARFRANQLLKFTHWIVQEIQNADRFPPLKMKIFYKNQRKDENSTHGSRTRVKSEGEYVWLVLWARTEAVLIRLMVWEMAKGLALMTIAGDDLSLRTTLPLTPSAWCQSRKRAPVTCQNWRQRLWDRMKVTGSLENLHWTKS